MERCSYAICEGCCFLFSQIPEAIRSSRSRGLGDTPVITVHCFAHSTVRQENPMYFLIDVGTLDLCLIGHYRGMGQRALSCDAIASYLRRPLALEKKMRKKGY